MPTKERIRIGVDVGGTFTDFVLVDGKRDVIFIGKQLTTPKNPSRAICEGIKRITTAAGVSIGDLDEIVHGTTLVTNTLIERNGAKIGLITTEGFRDVLEVGHEMRYDLYDLFMEKPQPLVERSLRKVVTERVNSTGLVLKPLDEEELLRVAAELVNAGVEALAVCFIHAYANPWHEQRAASILADAYPDLPVTISTAVAPEIREYERACTVAANAYVMPLMRRYVAELRHKLADMGLRGPLNVMLSAGGIAPLNIAEEAPIQLVESGPAAGAISGGYYGKLTHSDHVIAFDMGGTTAKMCLIEHGILEHSKNFEAGRVRRFRQGSGIPLKVQVIDLIEIGAGGGSIARLDAMGLLKVGPQSAGSEPGPVCYARGGQEPTVTDADLVLGYLSPTYFLGGEMLLDIRKVRQAIDLKLAKPGNLDVLQAAAGIHAVVNNNMAAATRRYIAEKGRDPRRYTLVATGGAGPVHAYGLAKELKIKRVIVPFGAGVSSALGFLLAPPATERVRSYVKRLDSLDVNHIRTLLNDMKTEAIQQLLEAGGERDKVSITYRAEMRYVGQGFEVVVDLPDDFWNSNVSKVLAEYFVAKYDTLFGRRIKDVPIEVVNWHITAAGPSSQIRLQFEDQQIDRTSDDKGERLVFFPTSGYVPAKVYNRYALTPGSSFPGPAIVEERESTVVIGPDASAYIDEHLNVIIDIAYDQAAAEEGILA